MNYSHDLLHKKENGEGRLQVQEQIFKGVKTTHRDLTSMKFPGVDGITSEMLKYGGKL